MFRAEINWETLSHAQLHAVYTHIYNLTPDLQKAIKFQLFEREKLQYRTHLCVNSFKTVIKSFKSTEPKNYFYLNRQEHPR